MYFFILFSSVLTCVGFVIWYLPLKKLIFPLIVTILLSGSIFFIYPSNELKKMQSSFPVLSEQITLLGKISNSWKIIFFYNYCNCLNFPICRLLILVSIDLSIYFKELQN